MSEETLADGFLQRLRIAILCFGLIIPASFQIYGGIDLLFKDFISPFLLWTLWAYFPYLVLFGLSYKFKNTLRIFLPFLLMAIIEIFVNIQVIFTESFEKSSLILLFLPLYQLVITLPFALLVALVVDKIRNRKLPPIMRK